MKKSQVIFILILSALYLMRCAKSSELPNQGRTLAQQYCSNCHLLPEPEHVDKKIWAMDVLPKMGALYGIYEGVKRASLLPDSVTAANIGHLYPIKPLMDSTTWQLIKEYYISNAPDKLARSDSDLTLKSLNRFKKISIPSPTGQSQVEITTLIDYDSTTQTIARGSKRGQQGIIDYFTNEHNFRNSRLTGSPPTKLYNGHVLEIGSLLPSDIPSGRLSNHADTTLIDKLPRPVDMIMMDLTQDGKEELIIAEYGNMIGGLRSYVQDETDKWVKDTTLISQPGAIMLHRGDLDNDGHEDLFVLFGQGDEGVFVIYSRPNNVEIRRLIRFPPSYGSSSFRIVDFDDDGHLDIFTTNGDNLDYEPRPKPYHGIRYFRNNGEDTFTEKWFYPFDGAYGLEIADFDLDGDYDIAAIAYFVPPLERSTQSFVYLEQENRMFSSSPSFQPFSFIKPVTEHYLCMTIGDIDKDGDMDLLIGSTSVYLPDGMQGLTAGSQPAYIVLENLTR